MLVYCYQLLRANSSLSKTKHTFSPSTTLDILIYGNLELRKLVSSKQNIAVSQIIRSTKMFSPASARTTRSFLHGGGWRTGDAPIQYWHWNNINTNSWIRYQWQYDKPGDPSVTKSLDYTPCEYWDWHKHFTPLIYILWTQSLIH